MDALNSKNKRDGTAALTLRILVPLAALQASGASASGTRVQRFIFEKLSDRCCSDD
ncbi:hypothetical protein SOVF_119710 isoform B [Spinacia oleracea]|nr:hypothetical protein SOVF_119710 isoform B [Spinacia oleracea]